MISERETAANVGAAFKRFFLSAGISDAFLTFFNAEFSIDGDILHAVMGRAIAFAL